MSGSQAVLKKSLRPVHLAAIGMGTTIGMGWVVVAGGWINDAGPGGAALAFVLGALIMGLVAQCYADLTIRLPEATNETAYVEAAFGRLYGRIIGWMVLLGFVGICCFEGLALAWVISVLAPSLKGPTLYTVLETPITLLDILVVAGGGAFFTFLNVIGARESASVQVAVTAGKIALGLVFIIIGIAGGAPENLAPVFSPADAPLKGMTLVLVTVPAWFCGFNALPQSLSEARERPSAKLIARLFASVIVLTALFYIGVIAATAIAAPRADLAGSELPVMTAIETVAGPWGGRIVLVTGVVALLSAWNAALFASSRMIYNLSASGALPSFLARVHPKFGTPVNAVIFVGAVALAGGMMGRAFIAPVLQLGALGFAIGFLATCASYLRLFGVSAPLPRVFAAGFAAISVWAVIMLSVYTMFAGKSGLPPEAAALATWIGIGWVLLAAARRGGTAGVRAE
ncbi:MAG TPA: APC family permease [Amphiplicatus sp.]|nr:APC family permease [Amphiplicatus sp.]